MRNRDLREATRLTGVRRLPDALLIADAALDQDPADVEALLLRARILRLAGRRDQATAAIEKAAPVVLRSGTPEERAELAHERAMILLLMNRFEEALATSLEAANAGVPNAEHYGPVCVALCALGRFDEAIGWRHRILRLRDAEAHCVPEDVITAGRPRAFDPGRPERNIVSYCLFGSDPYYHQCAITNARVTPVMYPEFTARFYCAPDLPVDVLKALEASGAQVMISRTDGGGRSFPTAGTYWRFLTFDDPDVDVVLCRDVDSPILMRERAAIDLWLAGDSPFYCLRDHPVHAELILAGMWGGFTGVLPRLGPLANAFVKTDRSRISDQRFLRSVIWPRLRHGAIKQIDSIASLDGSVDFPAGHPNRGKLHVGISWTRREIFGGGGIA